MKKEEGEERADFFSRGARREVKKKRERKCCGSAEKIKGEEELGRTSERWKKMKIRSKAKNSTAADKTRARRRRESALSRAAGSRA